MVTCEQCGLTYAEDIASDVRKHSRRHEKYLLACEHFGVLFPYKERERIKDRTSPIIHAQKWNTGREFSLQEKRAAAVEQIRAYFSRSVESWDYSLSHPPFKKYAAMLLNQKRWSEDIDPDVAQLLIKEFGQLPGIPEGHTYCKR